MLSSPASPHSTAASSSSSESAAGVTFDDDFQQLQDVWYRKRELCCMKWSPDGSPAFSSGDCLTTAAPNGGPIAIISDKRSAAAAPPSSSRFRLNQSSSNTHSSQLLLYSSNSPSSSSSAAVPSSSAGAAAVHLAIFTSAGFLISECPWSFDQLLTMNWTRDELLVCVFRNCIVRVFSLFCELLYCYHIDRRLKDENGLIYAALAPAENAIVILTGALKLYISQTLISPECLIRLADVTITSPPLCLKTVPLREDRTRSQSSEPSGSAGSAAAPAVGFAVLLSSEEGHIHLVEQYRSVRLPIGGGPFPLVSVSPSGRSVVCISQSGLLRVYSTDSDFSRALDQAVIRSPERLRQVCWVGDDCIAYYVILPTPDGPPENFVFVGGPGNEWLPYQFGQNSLFLVSEIDGLRVIGAKAHFIHCASSTTIDVLSVTSLKPASMLIYGCYHYSNESALVNAAMQTVLPELPQAILSCIDAAEREVEPARISLLLKSAAFGRLFLRDHLEAKLVSSSSSSSDAKACNSSSSSGNSSSSSSSSSSGFNSVLEMQKENLEELKKLKSRISKRYLRAVRDLRIVMALHSLPTEMLLTVAELRSVGIPLLMRILSRRRLHLMAFRIGEWLGLTQPKSVANVKIYDFVNDSSSSSGSSKMVRNLCPSFWPNSSSSIAANKQNMMHQNFDKSSSSSSSSSLFDATRPLGVSLALSVKSSTQSSSSSSSSLLPSSSSSSSYSKGMVNQQGCNLLSPSDYYDDQFETGNECINRNSSSNSNSSRSRSGCTGESSSASPLAFVMNHWIKEKIATSVEKTDQELLAVIRTVFDLYPHVKADIVEIAFWAANHSRPHLATLLIQFEPRSIVQVRVLLRLAEVHIAFKQAVAIGDADLLVECFHSVMNEADFDDECATKQLVEILSEFPLLCDFYEVLCNRWGVLEVIQRLYERMEILSGAAYVCILRSIHEANIEKKIHLVAHASGFFGSCKDLGQRGMKVAQQLSLEYVELITIQRQLEQKAVANNWTRQQGCCVFLNKSLAETVKQLYMMNQTQEVLTLQKLFELSPKRLLKIQIDALIENKQFDEVISLSQSPHNQSLVGGVEYFVKILHRSGNSTTAAKLLSSAAADNNSTLQTTWLPRLFQQQTNSTNNTQQAQQQQQAKQRRFASAAGSFIGSFFSRSSSS